MSWLSDLLGIATRGRQAVLFHDVVKRVAEETAQQLTVPPDRRDPDCALKAIHDVAAAAHNVLG